MPFNASTKFFYGFVTEVSGDATVTQLAYKYWACNIMDRNHQITGGPTKPKRPFEQDLEISGPLEVSSPIMVIEHEGVRTLVLLEQETYATEAC
jgi:hypothetical protein